MHINASIALLTPLIGDPAGQVLNVDRRGNVGTLHDNLHAHVSAGRVWLPVSDFGLPIVAIDEAPDAGVLRTLSRHS